MELFNIYTVKTSDSEAPLVKCIKYLQWGLPNLSEHLEYPINYHIYITTSKDSIVMGDWALQRHLGELSIVNCDKQNYSVINTKTKDLSAEKIIATSDTKLTDRKGNQYPNIEKEFINEYLNKLHNGILGKVFIPSEINHESPCTCDDYLCPHSFYNGDDYSCSKRFSDGSFWLRKTVLEVNNSCVNPIFIDHVFGVNDLINIKPKNLENYALRFGYKNTSEIKKED